MHVLLVSSKFEGEVELRYDERGILVKYENRAKMDDEMFHFFMEYFPRHKNGLQRMVEASKTLRVKEVPVDTSFASFWERYDKKINKKRCEPLYEKLSESERVQCIMVIKQYDFYLGRFNRVKMDPENWLKRCGWETEWAKIK